MVSLLSLPPVFGREDDTCSMHANNRPTALVYTVRRALKARASSVWPLPAGPTGSKGGKGNGSNNDGDTGGGSQELDHILDWDGPLLLSPSGGAAATRVVGK